MFIVSIVAREESRHNTRFRLRAPPPAKQGKGHPSPMSGIPEMVGFSHRFLWLFPTLGMC
jgi:hypothetical protein